ncbi:GntR family transcriptional regulator [Roseomonas terrae]|uniref:GntR family transcriptional regulator n=1 Tax=Neoroseomonas terrae TaxID=424799 RepID=A0ABS5EC98_9PROT|nr:GntR family transcriptional regulator [Neoroseomonas terrae]MBR0648639.1 GntR family transcriptional regulator [Neoroseomonas terrae]
MAPKPGNSAKSPSPASVSPAPRRGGTVDYIVADTEDAIHSGRLALGQRLVEADLVRELGVSRSSLREAFNRLSATGLVEIVANRGAVVRRIGRKEVADRFAIREKLEGLAAALTTKHLDEGDNRARFEAAGRYALSGNAGATGTERNRNYELHGVIADLSGNPHLCAMIRPLWLPAVMVEMRRSLHASFWVNSKRDHARIVEAILDRDAVAAEAAMSTHLRTQCEAILSLPARVFGE